MKKIFTLLVLAASVSLAAQPTTSATAPTEPASGVISVFSDSYTDVAGTNFNPNWGQATVYSAFTLGTDNMLKYATLNYQGIEFGSDINAASKGKLHLDVWSDKTVDVEFFCISRGAGSVTEASLTMKLVGNQWNTIDFDLADYIAKGLAVSDLFQFKFDEVARTISPTIYVDNIYFYGTAAATEPIVAANNPKQPAANVISIYSESYKDPASIDYFPNWGQSTGYSVFAIGMDSMIKYNNLNYQGITFNDTLDLSSMEYMHMDVWTANVDSLDVFPISVGSGEKNVRAGLTKSTWTSLDVSLSDFTAQGLDMSDIHQMKLVDPGNNAGTIFVDNIYFYKVPMPMVAAPAPTHAAADVISIYSESYTDPANINYYPNWGQSTKFKEFDISGDSSLEYSNLNYQGIEFGDTLDLTAMDSLHLDVWSTSVSNLEIYPISVSSGEKKVTHVITANTWNRVAIPLSDFTSQGLSMNDIQQFKFVDPDNNSGTIYLDNIYFSKPETNSTDYFTFKALKVYPNPTNDIVHVNAPNNTTVVNSIKLTNLQGQELVNRNVNSTSVNETFMLNDLSAGVYYLVFSTQEGIYTHKVVVK